MKQKCISAFLCFALKCFVDYVTSPNFPATRLWVANDWPFLFVCLFLHFYANYPFKFELLMFNLSGERHILATENVLPECVLTWELNVRWRTRRWEAPTHTGTKQTTGFQYRWAGSKARHSERESYLCAVKMRTESSKYMLQLTILYVAHIGSRLYLAL